MANYTTVRAALCGIITTKSLLYFNGRGDVFALLTAPWPIIPLRALRFVV